jgi:hypothetical protein
MQVAVEFKYVSGANYSRKYSRDMSQLSNMSEQGKVVVREVPYGREQDQEVDE